MLYVRQIQTGSIDGQSKFSRPVATADIAIHIGVSEHVDRLLRLLKMERMKSPALPIALTLVGAAYAIGQNPVYELGD